MKAALAGAWRWLISVFSASDPVPSPPPPVQKLLDQDFVLEKCAYFANVGLWPREASMPYAPWLDNFSEDDRTYGVHLLNAFIYFSRELTDALLVGAVQDLSRRIVRVDDRFDRAAAQWNDFLDSVYVTYPTGEVPSATDSGYAFARKARQVLGIPEARILGPGEVVAALDRLGPRPVLFLDDFLGTGNQFIETWERLYPTAVGTESFETLTSSLSFSAYYVPLVAAQLGMTRIANDAPDVTVSPAHVLTAEYSALAPDSFVWPAELAADAGAVLERVSRDAGIPDTGGLTPEDWRGFGQLALTLAFEQAVPDATLRLFYWTENDWTPLVRRT